MMSSVRATVRTLEVDSVRLSYRECGDPAAAPMLLLHGSGSDARTWDRMLLRLTAAGYRCIALDLRGHAASARTRDYSLTSIRDDVLHLLEALALQDVTLIGHSVGGYAALAAALHTPERIAWLVLEDLAAPPQQAARPSATGLLRALAAAAAILTQRRDYELRAVASIIRQLSRPDPGWWARLGDVRAPTLLFSGGPTSCIPPQRLADVTAAIPNARLTTIPVGHRVHSLAPHQFGAEVMAFLAERLDHTGDQRHRVDHATRGLTPAGVPARHRHIMLRPHVTS
jgi:pimeloyl-ACP methyl ester carboxylesterase